MNEARVKSFWASKTWWVSLALASFGEFHPRVNAWVSLHPHTTLLLTILTYLVLRQFTNSALHYGVKP